MARRSLRLAALLTLAAEGLGTGRKWMVPSDHPDLVSARRRGLITSCTEGPSRSTTTVYRLTAAGRLWLAAHAADARAIRDHGGARALVDSALFRLPKPASPELPRHVIKARRAANLTRADARFLALARASQARTA